MHPHIGQIAALATAFCWTVTGVTYQIAGRKIGSVNVNMIRMVIALVLLSSYSFFAYGSFLPTSASLHNIVWLSLSGLVGFVIGDLCLFQAYVLIGARISMLVMTLSSPIAAIFGWLIMGETMSPLSLVGMALTLGGIALVILERPTAEEEGTSRIGLKYPTKGLLLALGGAFGQGFGLVLSKYGIGNFNPIQGTQIRAIAALVGFTIFFFAIRQWGIFFKSLNRPKVISVVAIGSIFGPFLGVSLSLFAVQHATTGVASTIMSIMPIIIIPVSVVMFKEKVTVKEIIGAVIAIAGVALFFL
jgi:drug/metabolite transporter (DMT)-like permease